MKETPSHLIDSSGNPQFGAFFGYPQSFNVDDYVNNRHLSSFKRSMTEKRWEFIGLCGPDFVAAVAIVHAGYVGNAFLYCYDSKTDQLIEHEFLDPLAKNTTFDRDPQNGDVRFENKTVSILINNRADDGFRRVRASVRSHRKPIDFDFRIEETAQTVKPLSLVAETGPEIYNYTAKLAALPATGQITAGTIQKLISPDTCTGNVDWTAGFPARRTFWNWSMGQGYSTEGQRLGWNFSRGVYNIGTSENIFWIDGQPIKVDRVDFEYDPKQVMNPWHIRSDDGEVDLVFNPVGLRQGNLNLLLIKSDFKQPFGTYTGEFRTPDDVVVDVAGIWGVVEDHEALW